MGKELGRLIYGGSFNPLHIAHLRIALETWETIEAVDHVDFIPVANPAHKDVKGLLPFKLRVEMLKKALTPFPQFFCNEIEGEYSGISYTYNTLKECRNLYRGEALFFLLGSSDYAQLPTWHRGLELTDLCNLVVVTRGEFTLADFLLVTINFFPMLKSEKVVEKRIFNKKMYIQPLGNGKGIYFLPLHYLDISASWVRELWNNNRNIDFLVPPEVLQMLNSHKETVRRYWVENIC